MALRDQPYIPLYVQDVLTDEKLSDCSAQAHGVYFLLMCIMHKSSTYGTILLKQKYKQNASTVSNFALQLAVKMPFELLVIESALTELIAEGVIFIEGDFLIQKRMKKDGEISEKRAISGKKGGTKTGDMISDFAKANIEANNKANTQAKIEQNTEIEIEYEIEYIEKKGGVGERKTNIDQVGMSSDLLPFDHMKEKHPQFFESLVIGLGVDLLRVEQEFNLNAYKKFTTISHFQNTFKKLITDFKQSKHGINKKSLRTNTELHPGNLATEGPIDYEQRRR